MIEELKDFGLSDNEITTYLTVLKTGEATANRVAKLSGLKRSTTYDNLNLLITKGIVSKAEHGRVTYYQAAEPQKIVDLLEEKKRRMRKIIPKLESLQSTAKEKTGVTFYEGKQGVLTVLNDILEQKQELWFFGSRKMALIALRHYPENFILRRAQAKIKLRAVLASQDRGDPAYTDKKVFRLSTLRFNKSVDNINANTFIYGDRVAFMSSTDNPVGIIIKNKEVVQQQRAIFNTLWKQAKP